MTWYPEETPEPFRTLGHVAAGIGWGVLFATILSLLVGLLALRRGSVQYPEYGTSTGVIIGSYYAAGLLCGTVFGLLHRLRRSTMGAVLIGALVGTCVYGAVGLAVDGWTRFNPMVAVIAGVPVGGLLGYRWREGVR